MIGCDIIEIERVASSLDKLGQNFICAILSSREIELYNKRGNRVEFVAGRFAAKEAISKALGTGIGRGLSFTDIEILSNDLGKPEVYIKEERVNHIEVSISHSKKDAMAVCLIKEVL